MPMPIASARCRPTPALIDGLSWSALGIVLAFCALASLESTLAPHMGIVGSGGRDVVLAWLVRIPVFMVNGVTVLVIALVVLNAAGHAGRLKPALAIAAAVAGCAAASVTRYAIGATPVAEGPVFMVNAFITWFVPAAVLVVSYVFYLHTRAAREQVNAAQLQRAALEKQQLETPLCPLPAQIEPHFLFNTLSNLRRPCRLGRGTGQHTGAARRAIRGARDAQARGQLAVRRRRYHQAAVDPRRKATMSSVLPATRSIPGGASRGWFSGFGRRHLCIVLAFCAVVPITGLLFKLAVEPTMHHGAVAGEGISCFVIGLAAMLSVIATENRLAGVLGPVPRMAIAVLVAAATGTVLMEAVTQLLIRPLGLPFEGGETAMYSGDFHRIAYRFFCAATWSLMLIALYAMLEASRRATKELHAVRVAALAAERSVLEGDLRAMQARVDPDLLFDTLLAVDRAYAGSVRSGEEALDALSGFLRAG